MIADGAQHFHTFHRENKTDSDAEAKKEAKAKTSSHEQIRAFAEEVNPVQITIEGTVKEVAALVLELQERRRNESEVSNTYACNLVVKDDDISNIDICSIPKTDASVR